ncbi:MAG: hypothetical protein Kow0031_18820 [Anaerolineae bacterium]
MTLTNIPRQKPDYRMESLDDELLLYHPGSTQIMYCNQTASLVWQLTDGRRTVADIIELLAAAYPDTAGSIADDVTATLQQFADHGAIEWV